MCRKVGVSFISSETRGLFANVFIDFGLYKGIDDGRKQHSGVIVDIFVDKDGNGIVDTQDLLNNSPFLEMQDGDEVIFKGVGGMEELNDQVPRKITRTYDYEGNSISNKTRSFCLYILNWRCFKVWKVYYRWILSTITNKI
jgi:ubiquitin-activating enzyme E1